MGAPVFNKSVGTDTRSNASTKDNASLVLGSLSTSKMDQPDALATVKPGLDTKLIHGDMGEWIDSNRQSQIHVNETRIVDGKMFDTVTGDVKQDFASNRDLIIGMSKVVHIGLDRDA